jgi:ribosomal protein S18 acetylase RimI-like enzyme
MIERARGLSARELHALAGLEERVVAADGGRLKLEWGVLRSRSGREVEDLLWWEGEQLTAFLGLYGFVPPTVEIAGMVDPGFRRRGIFGALLDAAVPLCRDRGYLTALLIVPRVSSAGRAFALRRGAAPEHSEHALVLRSAASGGASDPRVTLRAATAADAPELDRILVRAFGEPSSDVLPHLAQPRSQTLAVLRDGAIVGTVRVERDGQTAGIYGFAIDPAWQGQGIGRTALLRVCETLSDQGVSPIAIEVAVDNDHALGLYTSLGFVQVATEDYYALDLGAP